MKLSRYERIYGKRKLNKSGRKAKTRERRLKHEGN